ncbi:MAG: CoA transferase [Candidatus Calescibacterium sp.]|nr:CoA transferase [Candidatus Calescibacterium sp.]MCX7733451.1 CoA transferase [bacterium]MDW8087522.1 CaiB/BaiF CoA-transferase family protein [Candidatus Calescibacterium sp.]
MIVLDFTRLLPGPLATYILAHLGFEIIKVEDTKGSDITRYTPPFTEWGESSVFSFLNAGKKSIAVDLKTDEGVEIARKLAQKSDVIVEGFRPGVMKKLGLDFDNIKKINPKIVYCSISGYGQDGQYSQKSGHDINYIALSGILKLFVSENLAVVPGVQIADISGAIFAVIGILSKLLERERDKNFSGYHIDISMTETSLFFGVESLSKFLVSKSEPEPFGEVLTGGVICYNLYKTKDGKWVSIGALEPKFWENLTKALGLDLLPSDAMSKPSEKNEAYIKLREKILSLTSEELDSILSKYDIPYEFVRSYSEAISHNVIRERKLFYSIEENGKKLELLKLPFMKEVKNISPTLGQHTTEILNKIGYSDQKIHELRQKGVIL